MRLKQLWRHCDIPAKASLVWSRITFSRITTTYFIVAVLHCFIQVIIQGHAYSINAAAADHLWSFVQQRNMTKEASGFAILGHDLRICYFLPNTINPNQCPVIWGGKNQSSPSNGMDIASAPLSNAPASTLTTSEYLPVATTSVNDSPKLSIPAANSTLSTMAPVGDVISAPALSASQATPTTKTSNSELSSEESVLSPSSIIVVINPTSTPHAQIVEASSDDASQGLSRRSVPNSNDICAETLLWPVQELSNTKREDITLIGFQVWVLGMSIVALLNESIQHICAALVTQLLVTIWTVFQVTETEQFRRNFAKIITNGACHGMNILGSYWEQRKAAEILSAVLNGVGLFVTAILTYKLLKIYGWQTFKRVGASLTINRIYKLVLLLSIAIQLALFFIVSAAALWIDQLYNGAVGRMATSRALYKGGIILIFCLLIPWLSLGWFSVRREARMLALLFLVLSLLFISLWAALFKSTSFRWTFVLWPFFAVMAVVSGALMVITFILGLICRFNFGKGLPRYLSAEEPLEGEDFLPVFPEKCRFDDDPEKVEFPSSNGRSVPTFSATFGKGIEVPKPTRIQFGPSRVKSLTRSVSSSSSSSTSSMKDVYLTRMESRSSEMSHNSDSSTTSQRTDMGKRWVIE